MKNLKFTMILMALSSAITQAAPVGTQFSYQGQLNENGVAVSGSYTFQFILYGAETGAVSLAVMAPMAGVPVNNGLFTAELDFGDVHFDGEEVFLEIRVKEDSQPVSNILTPRQRINTVPYAIQSAFVENSSSPWQEITGGVGYIDDVKIGNLATITASMLTVDSVGSPVRFKIGGSTKMVINTNGGTSLGNNASAPDNGLRVEGISRLFGDVDLRGDLQQEVENNGAIKAGLVVTCADNGASSVFRSFNAVNDQAITIQSSSTAGRCTVTFPFSLLDRYYVAMPFNSGAPARMVNCQQQNLDSPDLICFSTDSNGNGIDTNLSILVY